MLIRRACTTLPIIKREKGADTWVRVFCGGGGRDWEQGRQTLHHSSMRHASPRNTHIKHQKLPSLTQKASSKKRHMHV